MNKNNNSTIKPKNFPATARENDWFYKHWKVVGKKRNTRSGMLHLPTQNPPSHCPPKSDVEERWWVDKILSSHWSSPLWREVDYSGACRCEQRLRETLGHEAPACFCRTLVQMGETTGVYIFQSSVLRQDCEMNRTGAWGISLAGLGVEP